ncbi:hypothetical protein JCM16418_4224 [Paenibacillus pini JCM 16418]|uniref:Uncharacterized protein n=1 Tax=Paenibacillus pini JCM 16418 TaxID=1236976 RepID=W7YRJ0_9BACL|nr:hypothetical protein JCM16418_4224 [Paenibacillus pini JCM 16418]
MVEQERMSHEILEEHMGGSRPILRYSFIFRLLDPISAMVFHPYVMGFGSPLY